MTFILFYDFYFILCFSLSFSFLCPARMVPEILPVEAGSGAEHDWAPQQRLRRDDGEEHHRAIQVRQEARGHIRICSQVTAYKTIRRSKKTNIFFSFLRLSFSKPITTNSLYLHF